MATYREKISRGLIPRDMEDMEGSALFFHRSWTGFCIYKVEFAEENGKHIVQSALASRDPEQYNVIDNKEDRRLLDFLLQRVLLGKA